MAIVLCRLFEPARETSDIAQSIVDIRMITLGTLGGDGSTPVDWIVIPVFKAALNLINLAKEFSPIDNLSTGRSIPWSQLGRAFAQVVLLLGGIFALSGMFIFSRRELATAQGTH